MANKTFGKSGLVDKKGNKGFLKAKMPGSAAKTFTKGTAMGKKGSMFK